MPPGAPPFVFNGAGLDYLFAGHLGLSHYQLKSPPTTSPASAPPPHSPTSHPQ
jgi:hypothetical protein